MPTNRVDLIDEDDARRVLLGLVEHVAHAGGADADQQQNWKRRDEELEQERLLLRRVGRNLHVVLLELTDQYGVLGFRVVGDERIAIAATAADGFTLEHDFLDGAVLDPRKERRI